jgi:hypothetical protein
MTKRKIPRNGIERAAKRAGVKPAKSKATVKVTREELERWDGLLERAQTDAIKAAPRPLPQRGDGVEAAIRTFDTIGYVRGSLARLIAAEGGAS